MAVVLWRVDDRLIHGQVVVGWVRETGANAIVVVNDAVAVDPLQRSLLPLAVPPEIRVRVERITDAVTDLNEKKQSDGEKTIVLFSNPVDVLAFLKAGGRLKELNLGGMRFGPGKIQVDRALSLSPDDIEALDGIRDAGVNMAVRMVPEDRARNIFELIRRARG